MSDLENGTCIHIIIIMSILVIYPLPLLLQQVARGGATKGGFHLLQSSCRTPKGLNICDASPFA
ncbi:MAG: hypothetical protein AAFY41_19945, partial [Bacteroidota bacterium]